MPFDAKHQQAPAGTNKHQEAPDYYATSDHRTKLLEIRKG